MRKLVARVLVCIMILGLLSGCGTKTTQEQQGTSSEEKIDIAKGILPQKYKGTEINFASTSAQISKLTPEFEKATGIKVNVTTLDYVNLHKKIALDFASKKGEFDAIAYPYQWYGEFVGKNENLVPLDEYAAKKGFPDLKLDDYIPAALDNYGKFNNKLYGLPLVGDVEFLMYNTKMFKEQGIANPPKTWEELVVNGQKLTIDNNKDGKIDQYGFGLMGGRSAQAAGTFYNLFYANGGEVFNDKMKPQFNSAAGVKALTLMGQDLKKIAPPDSNTWDVPENSNAFIQGKTAMSLFWPGSAGATKDPAKSKVVDDVGFALSPNNSSLLGGWALGISQYSKNKDATYLFISWLTSPEIQKKYAELGGGPTRQSVLNDKDLVNKYPWFPTIAANLAVAKPFPKIPESEEIIGIIYEEANDVVTGTKTPQQGADTINSRVEKLMTEHGYYK